MGMDSVFTHRSPEHRSFMQTNTRILPELVKAHKRNQDRVERRMVDLDRKIALQAMRKAKQRQVRKSLPNWTDWRSNSRSAVLAAQDLKAMRSARSKMVYTNRSPDVSMTLTQRDAHAGEMSASHAVMEPDMAMQQALPATIINIENYHHYNALDGP